MCGLEALVGRALLQVGGGTVPASAGLRNEPAGLRGRVDRTSSGLGTRALVGTFVRLQHAGRIGRLSGGELSLAAQPRTARGRGSGVVLAVRGRAAGARAQLDAV